MTEAEEQELFARLGRLERSNWRWKVLATVLGVFFLLLVSLAVLVTVDMQVRHAVVLREALEVEQQFRRQAEQKPPGRVTTTGRMLAPAPKRMPREPGSGEAP